MKKYLFLVLVSCTNLMILPECFVKNINLQAFDQEVLKAELPVFFQISVAWCSPCKVLKPIVEELSVEFKDTILFIEIDVSLEENRDILQTVFQDYGVIIGSFPVVFIFNQGKYIQHFNARALSKKELIKKFKVFLK